jgi:hypothetical protein
MIPTDLFPLFRNQQKGTEDMREGFGSRNIAKDLLTIPLE